MLKYIIFINLIILCGIHCIHVNNSVLHYLIGLPEQSLQHVQEGKEILESLPPGLRDESSCLHALSLANCIFSQILLLSEQ